MSTRVLIPVVEDSAERTGAEEDGHRKRAEIVVCPNKPRWKNRWNNDDYSRYEGGGSVNDGC